MKNLINSINYYHFGNINLWVEDWVEQMDYLKNETVALPVITTQIYVMI